MRKRKRRKKIVHKGVMRLSLRHYWSKTADCAYGGEIPRVFTELVIALIMLPITIYCYGKPGLELFFAGFLIPTIMFSVGSIHSLISLIASEKNRAGSRVK